MINFNIPNEKKIRVILDTDAKNEVDDQFAIVQAVLSESFDIKGIVAAHFGNEKSKRSMEDSYDEINKVLSLMNINNIEVYRGAKEAIKNDLIPQNSEGVRFIINEAMKDDERPLYIAVLGAITNIASALLLEPKIADKNVTIVWIGGRDYPTGGWEYNLKNDVNAANIVLKSNIKLYQVPRNVYRMMPVTFAELRARVYPYGEIGKYLTENVIEFNNAWLNRPTEYRILGDSPAIGIMLFEDCGEWELIKAPEIDDNMNYVYNNSNNRLIRVYKNIDSRFILEDLYSKLKLYSDNN